MRELDINDIRILADIYTAIGGLVSEVGDPFDHFYKGGTAQMDRDFQKVLVKLGVRMES